MRTLAARLSAKISIRNGISTCNGKEYPTNKGEWRWRASTHSNAKESGEIVKIGKSKARRFFHIGVNNDDGLFALASGVMTYNSKANPNLEYLGKPFMAYLKRQVAEAKEMPSQESIVKRLNFCIWSEGSRKWIPADKWNICGDLSLNIENYIGKPCYIGLDLASKLDICALIMVFSIEENLIAFCNFYMPEDTVRESKNRQYERWVKDGYITQTPGTMTDFKYIEDDLKAINSIWPIIQIGFDPREAGYLINNVMEWTKEGTCVEINQGPAAISQPMKELEGRIYAKQLRHDNNPVLGWMISNVVLKESRGGPVKYYFPTKSNIENKIDGAVALIMAISRAMSGDERFVSAYEGMTVEEIKARMTL